MDKDISKLIKIYGLVQGVGFRPAVSRLAKELGLKGYVKNKGAYVEALLEGAETLVDRFIYRIEAEAPAGSDIKKIEQYTTQASGCAGFEIIESSEAGGERICPPDIAVCEECSRELFSIHNRRYRHPFINCTACGPRYTIMRSLPYDRVRTAMSAFPLCKECGREFISPSSRRYDAQAICCPGCGPEVYLLRKGQEGLNTEIKGEEAIKRVQYVIRNGGIAAIKGIGGFHLCCSALDPRAVGRLRSLKHRGGKPFAVMVRDMDVARRECLISDREEAVLSGREKPILLLPKREGGRIAPLVAPDSRELGLMLPYAPVQLLIFDAAPDALVMTSGNRAGLPIATQDCEAVKELSGLSDIILSNNRDIFLRADDSVMAFFLNKPLMLRRSRGYAPLPISFPLEKGQSVLSLGGELKNTICRGREGLFYLSAHIGDIGEVEAEEVLEETVPRLETLLDIAPQAICCDLHPSYATARIAEKIAKRRGLPLIRVQHHYAHILSCMAENNYRGKGLGVAFDGTGYGRDGSIWGGEVLEADLSHFERLSHITLFKQPGGDKAAKEGWRVALSMIYSVLDKGQPLTGDGLDIEKSHVKEEFFSIVEKLDLCGKSEAGLVLKQLDLNINCIVSSSMGRLFDAVSAILGIKNSSDYEGEAAMALEREASKWERAEICREDIKGENEGPYSGLLRTDLIFSDILRRRIRGEERGELAYRFHYHLSRALSELLMRLRKERGINTVALSGGSWQNRLLLSLTCKSLEEAGFKILLHRKLPPNDGGIALGQAVYASAMGPGRRGAEDSEGWA